ncbi:MAG: ribosomal large subunit methyltransferase [Pseudomonadota bacterium]|jgi:23S rRNA (adenine1618-N6)-methyltransferase
MPATRQPNLSPFHPRNRHQGEYDFTRLIAAHPPLAQYVQANAHGARSIDFANAAAVKALNCALLQAFYGIQGWDIPAGNLCPPVPGRADYIHYLADLLAACNGGSSNSGSKKSRIPKNVQALDIGCGANCIYPLIAASEYGWQVVGSDINAASIQNAQTILDANPAMAARISLRQQSNPQAIFEGVLRDDEWFDLTLCNPPFHPSRAAAQAGSARKWRNLGKDASAGAGSNDGVALNFGGQDAELWCEGGELAFIQRMIAESRSMATRCLWFTTLVSQAENLPKVLQALKVAKVQDQRTVAMSQGQKQSRFVAWTFLEPKQQAAWGKVRWG